ncbi:hypothetical protein ACQP2F_28310 [Actinoplanes sp. CA-030573]|uniref:hypothetical protein n=1 Tax=Actinoplanes sp. CA-030573 TaxID=3239898 RepID=UPI003D902985
MPHDWRESLRLAADLALLGIVVTLLSLPLLTAGAAVATGSHAIRHLIAHGRWPSLADCWAVFRRRLVPGLIAGPAVALGSALLLIDIAALRRGAVPGGGPVLTLVLAIGALAAGYVALVAVEAGTLPPGTRRPGAARSAFALAWARPVVPLAAAGVLAVVAVLALLVHPALVPVLAGYALFALHVVTPKVAGPRLTRAA